MENFEKIHSFLHIIERLKTTIRFDVAKNTLNESVADHSWRLAMMVFVVSEELGLKLDELRAVKLALVHDIGTYAKGDVDHRKIVAGKVSREIQKESEGAIIEELKGTLPLKIGQEFMSLWKELEENSSQESKFVKALEKLETLSHIYEAGYKTYNKPEQIPNYANKAVREFPVLEEMLRELKEKLKLEFQRGNIPWKETYNRLD